MIYSVSLGAFLTAETLLSSSSVPSFVLLYDFSLRLPSFVTHCSKPCRDTALTKHHQFECSPGCQSHGPWAGRLCPEYPGAQFLFAFPLQKACGCYYTCWCSVSLTSHLKHDQVLFSNRQSGIQPTSIRFICHVLLSASKQTGEKEVKVGIFQM